MENTLNARRAAQILGVTVKTLQRWEREGKRPLTYNGSRPALQTFAAETRYPWRVGRQRPALHLALCQLEAGK